MIEYTSSRLCFKADLIEPLKDNDVFVVHTLNGTFKFTKADFYRVFSNVIETKSYQEGRLYSCKYPPKRALPFLISGQKQGDNDTNKQTPKNVINKMKNMYSLISVNSFIPIHSSGRTRY